MVRLGVYSVLNGCSCGVKTNDNLVSSAAESAAFAALVRICSGGGADVKVLDSSFNKHLYKLSIVVLS